MTITELFQCTYIETIFDFIQSDIEAFDCSVETIPDLISEELPEDEALVTILKARLEMIQAAIEFSTQIQHQVDRLSSYYAACTSIDLTKYVKDGVTDEI